MGMSAFRDLAQAGAPEVSSRVGSFRPESPEEIEPILGILPCQWSFSDEGGYPPAVVSESLHYDGPSVNNFWVGKTIKGEIGQLRGGFKHIENGDYCVTYDGDMAVSALVYKSVIDRLGRYRSLGLESPEGEIRVSVHDTEKVKRMLARGVFYLLNPSQSNNATSYGAITEKSKVTWARAKARYTGKLPSH
ncbi:hypothetical protein COU14_00745 [Candidatus Kaiserbacteria bacterium CG10_big_fil_rev_8_21_14_0_10_44_10]|uniref:Uncharacterized protein n=1 Tax=Candidatus Kaiserbacteria bacterium CG10_big_fil_rev_8_21_14_0_10_44_10 TaxID=1974606 RepID=A0A2H0UJZ6_9BACT|nr:MAG: hypothetical protein COU14_00745 [Candidatus Kaiserbacteria bacterium CG10_big_fil_rev_8_21_14_0_10_44_10]